MSRYRVYVQLNRGSHVVPKEGLWIGLTDVLGPDFLCSHVATPIHDEFIAGGTLHLIVTADQLIRLLQWSSSRNIQLSNIGKLDKGITLTNVTDFDTLDSVKV